MDQSVLMDTIPFRCPKCGNTKSFSSLAELRVHLSSEHSYPSPQSQRDGTKVFNYSGRSRERSPLLQAFLEDGRRLEEEVRKAKEQERKNKLLQENQPFRDSVLLGPTSPLLAEDSHLRSALSSLSNEVAASRQQQYRTADNLYATQDILNSVEQAAEDQRQRQQLLMSRLAAGQVRPSPTLPDPLHFHHPANGFVTAAEVHRPSPSVGVSRSPLHVSPVPGLGNHPLGDPQANVFAKASQLEQAQVEIQRLREDQRQLLESIEQLRHRADADNQALIQGLRSREQHLQQINLRLAGSVSPRHRAVSPTVPLLRQSGGAEDGASRQLRGQVPLGSSQGKSKQLDPDEIPVRDSSPDQEDYPSRPKQGKTLLPKVQNRDKEDKNRSEKVSPKRKVDFEEEARYGDEPRHKDEQRQRDNTRHRDEQLTTLQRRSERLEEDRQLLLQEMENLLSKAASANEKLRAELHAKELQLQQLNKEVQQAKLNQSELMGETIELYSQADSNIAKLKELLLVKEEQLSTANGRLGQMRDTFNKAVLEREAEAREAEGRCQLLQTSLEAAEAKLAATQAELRRLAEERERGLQEASRLRGQMDSQHSTNTRLQQDLAHQEQRNQQLKADIEGKEKQLTDTKKELDSVTNFIKTTAAKELEARKKLEKFITDLIERADNAEQQLRTMRREVEGRGSTVSGDGSSAARRGQPATRAAPASQTAAPHSSSEASDSLSQLRKLPASEIKIRAKHALQKNLKPWQPDFTSPTTSSQQPGEGQWEQPMVQSAAPTETSMPDPRRSGAPESTYLVGEFPGNGRLVSGSAPHPPEQRGSTRASGMSQKVPVQNYQGPLSSVPQELEDRIPTRDFVHGRQGNDYDYEGHYAEVDFEPLSYNYSGGSGGKMAGRSHTSNPQYSGGSSEAELMEPMYASIVKPGMRSPRHSTPLPPDQPPALPARERIVRENAGSLQQAPGYPAAHPGFPHPQPGVGSRPPPSQPYWQGDRGRDAAWQDQHVSAPRSSLGAPPQGQSLGSSYQDGDPRTYIRQYSPSEASYQNGRLPHHAPPPPPPPGSAPPGLHSRYVNTGGDYPPLPHATRNSAPPPEWLQERNGYPVLEESGYGSHYRTMPGQADVQAASSGYGFDPASGHYVDKNSYDPRHVVPSVVQPLERRRAQPYPDSSLSTSDGYRERNIHQRNHPPSLKARQSQGVRKSTGPGNTRHTAVLPTASFESDSGWDGRELSLDENGIMWEDAPADATWTKDWDDDPDSCRLSPSGSETAGDVDSSLLLSGSSASRSSPPKEKAPNGELGASLDEKFAKFLGKDWRKNLGGEKLSPVKEETVGHENSGGRYARTPSRQAEKSGRVDGVDREKRATLKSGYKGEEDASLGSKESGSRAGKDMKPVQEDIITPMPAKRQFYKPPVESSKSAETPAKSLQGGQADSAGTPINQAKQSDLKDDLQRGDVKREAAKKERGLDQTDSRIGDAQQPIPEKPPRAPEARRGSLAKQKSLYPERQGVDAEKLPSEPSDSTPGRNGPQGTKQNGDATKLPMDTRNGGSDKAKLENGNVAQTKKPDEGRAKGGVEEKLVAEKIQSEQVSAGAETKQGNANPAADPYALTEEERIEIANAPRKRAQPLRARFQDDSSDEESESESVQQPEMPKESFPQAEESTDFDLESDFEKVNNPPPLASRPAAKKSPVRKAIAARRKAKTTNRRNPAAALPGLRAGFTDEESSALSDVDDPKKRRKEEARRRRIALFHVFTYLDTRTLCQVAQVCREWKRVSRHASLWKRVVLKNERVSSEFLATISQWCTQLHTLTLEGLRVRARRDNESEEEYNQNTRACLEPGLEQVLKASQNSLRSLTILDCSNVLTDKSLWLASCYSRLLERLTYVSSMDPVGPELLFALGGGCPGITSLVIPPLHPCLKPTVFSNKCLMLIGKFYRDLLVLGVGGKEINASGLLPVVQSCQRLQSLQLDHTVEMTGDLATGLCKAGLNNLQELELIGTAVTDKAIKAFHKSCKHLTRIHIVVSIADYYEDVNHKKSKEGYKKAVDNLKKLEKQAGLGNILTLQAAPVE